MRSHRCSPMLLSPSIFTRIYQSSEDLLDGLCRSAGNLKTADDMLGIVSTI